MFNDDCLTSLGKVDKQKLINQPSLMHSAKVGANKTSSRTDALQRQIIDRNHWTTTQLNLLKLFEKLLETSEIDLNDHFHDCGGNSLLTFSLLIEIKKQFGKLLTLSEINADTILALSEIIDNKELKLKE